ncbi:MAG: hypothetical protein RLZZ196_1172 [Bacteroidota bacterium]|jgi:hypothetical protein
MAKKSNKLNKTNKGNKKYIGVTGFQQQVKPPFVNKSAFPNLGVKNIPNPQDNTYFTQNAPYGTITSGDVSYAPGSFNLNTPFTSYSNEYDADPFVPGVQQGPVTQERAQQLNPNKTDVVKDRYRSPFENVRRNEAVTAGLFLTDAYLRKNQAIRDNYNYQKRLRNVFTQKPIYDYNYLHGPDSSGGTEYQSLIMAKDGAQIRKTASPNFGDVEVEGGEFIQLPDLTTQHVQGPSHAKGGVHTSLPEGSRVFSDFLKPLGSKKTYAQLAKKYDTTEYKKILDNPYANQIDRNTAKKMFDRNESILNELFQDQQIQNGNSDGTDQAAEMTPEMMAKFGLDLKKGEKLSFTDPFQMGGEYMGGYAEFQDGGMFPSNSTFYNNPQTPNYGNNDFFMIKGDYEFQDGGMYNPYEEVRDELSLANTINTKDDNKFFQEGGVYVSPVTKRKYKIPQEAIVKKEGDKSIKPGDYVVFEDGTVKKVTKLQAKRVANKSETSGALTDEEGKSYISRWTEESPENRKTLELAEKAIQKGIENGQIKYNKDNGTIDILGNFSPNLEERLAISEVINKSGKRFGTLNYKINSQALTTEYTNSKNEKNKGSFVGGFTPLDYEQRATYARARAEGMSKEEAIALAETKDPKQKAANRKAFLNEIQLKDESGKLVDVDSIPESYLISDDFYKTGNRFTNVINAIETSFPEGSFRPVLGNDNLGGFEHYDAAAYISDPRYMAVAEEEEAQKPEDLKGRTFTPTPPFEQTPSTPGKFPAYQALPEALGFLAGMNPYTYYTPDYTHTELVPPTLNIDDELQSINNTVQSAMRQTTGNPSLDNSRNAALFNTALQAKQQAFAKKQNYDAQARFQADQYNAQARDLENFRDVSSAAQVYNEYMAGAQDAAEAERLGAIFSLVDKTGKFNRDEFLKMMYFTTMYPNYYYEGTDLRNPIKLNPKAKQYWDSQWANKNKGQVSSMSFSPGVTPAAPPATPPMTGTQTLNTMKTSYPTDWNSMYQQNPPALPNFNPMVVNQQTTPFSPQPITILGYDNPVIPELPTTPGYFLPGYDQEDKI